MTIFEQINLNHLSAVEQEIYRFIVNHLAEIPYMRVREIAEGAHVSATSVFRFIQKLGYESFPEFRISIKTMLKQTKQTNDSTIMGIEERIDALNMTIYHPDIEYQIKQMADYLRAADFILFMGMGASGAIAQYIARKLASIGYFSLCIEELTYPIKSFLRSKQKNVLVFLSVSGETKELLEVISGIEKNPATKKYCITQNRKSTLAQHCDYSIEYDVKEERKNIFFDLTSQLPVMAILETLIAYLK